MLRYIIVGFLQLWKTDLDNLRYLDELNKRLTGMRGGAAGMRIQRKYQCDSYEGYDKD